MSPESLAESVELAASPASATWDLLRRAGGCCGGTLATEWWVPVLTFAGGSGVTLAVEYLRSLTARADRSQAAIERREDREVERSARPCSVVVGDA